MNVRNGMNAAEAAGERDLGIVICKRCGEVIGTLPTESTKKIYGVCSDSMCAENAKQGGQTA